MSAVLGLLCLLAFAYQLVVFAAIVMSWFPVEPGTPLDSLRGVLDALTEPVLAPLRQALPALRAGGLALDLSPLAVLLVLMVLRAVIC